MKEYLFDIDKEECSRLATDYFMADSGLYREGHKFEKMREDAFRMRGVIEERIKIRAMGIYSEEISFSGRKAVIENVEFACNAFELIDPASVRGVYLYALSVGDFGYPEEPIMDQLYADIWGSAFTDAARVLIKAQLESESRLSDSFGPGFYGMDVSEMPKLASMLSFDKLDMEIRNSRILLPLKSCAGMYFAVNDDYVKLNSACESCRGNHKSCVLCHVYGGVN